jgi:uncharacterized protein (DUF952 family)
LTGLIYKIFTPAQWALWRELGITLGSADDQRDGFIHFSTGAQLRGTLEKHFTAHSLLWLAGVEPPQLGASLKWEPSRGGQLFPHLYGPFHLRTICFEGMVLRAAGEWSPLPENMP